MPSCISVSKHRLERRAEAQNDTVERHARLLCGNWPILPTSANGPNHGKIGLTTALINDVGLFSYQSVGKSNNVIILIGERRL
jgi:hypothetical protein